MVVRHELGHCDIGETCRAGEDIVRISEDAWNNAVDQYGYDSIEAVSAELIFREDELRFGDRELVCVDGRLYFGDGVCDQSEREGCMGVLSMDSELDTYNLRSEISPTYASYGDDEVRVRRHEADDISGLYDMSKDWSDPGCQHKNRFGPIIVKEGKVEQ